MMEMPRSENALEIQADEFLAQALGYEALRDTGADFERAMAVIDRAKVVIEKARARFARPPG